MFRKITHSALVNVIKRETLRIVSSKVLLLTTVIGPILSFAIIWWIFSAGVVRDLPVALVDQDNSTLSRKIQRMVETTPVSTIKFTPTSIYEAKQLLNDGKVDAIILVPFNTEQLVLKGEAPQITIFLNNTNLVKGGALKSGLYKTFSTLSSQIKYQFYLKKENNSHEAFLKIQPIKLNTHILFNPFGNYAYFLALGLLPLMLTVFTLLGSVYALGIELKDHTAGELIKVAGNRVSVALTGKFFPYTLLYFMNAMAMNLIIFKVSGTPIQGSLTIIILSELLLIVAYQALAVLFLQLTANPRLSLSMGSAYSMMALTFSGLTFPTMAMPLVAKIFSFIFPYTFWLKIFLSQSLRGEPIQRTVIYMVILLLFFLMGILAFPGMKKKLTNPLMWGKD